MRPMCSNGDQEDRRHGRSLQHAHSAATAAALQLDACVHNFLIQELYPYRIPEHFALVDHAPELDVRNGYLTSSDRQGLGVELVEDRVRPYLWAKV
jgi:galactonate dehydratase